MSEQAIQALQGKTFTISLGVSGGVNYVWCLTSLPEGVALAHKDYEFLNQAPGGLVNHIFTFFAVKGGNVKIGFKLLNYSNPEETAKEVFFNVCVIPHNQVDGLTGFIRYSENSASYVADSCGCQENPVIKYSYPADKYGFPGCPDSNIIVKYSYPVTKYNYPGCPDGNPVVKYSYPADKYGYPGCPDGDIVVKYSYPADKYGYPGCPDGDIVVKYSYPVSDYGFPGCK